MPHLIVHTLILNPKNQVLIIKRAKQEKVLPGLWDLPGGSLRLKEGPAKGAIREAFEETGLKIIEPKIFASVSNWDKAKQTQFIILFFRSVHKPVFPVYQKKNPAGKVPTSTPRGPPVHPPCPVVCNSSVCGQVYI